LNFRLVELFLPSHHGGFGFSVFDDVAQLIVRFLLAFVPSRCPEKVFKKMGFMISPLDIEAVVQCKKHAIERILLLIQSKIGEYQSAQASEVVVPAAPVSPVAAAVPRHIPPPAHVQPAPAAAAAPAPAAARKKAAGVGVQRDLHQRHQSQPQVQSPQRAAHVHASAAAAAAPAGSHPAAAAAPIGGGDREASAAIHDLRETVDILQLKVQKLEQLLRLKNSKIESLQKKLEMATGQPQH